MSAFLQTISENTLIPIGIAVAIVIAAASYTAWLSAKFTSLSDKITSQGTDLRERIQKIEFMLGERFTKEEFRRWERGLFLANPELKAPDEAP